MNLTAGWEGDEDDQEYAVGVRNALTDDPHGVAAGLDLATSTMWRTAGPCCPASTFRSMQQTLLKTGLEIGNGQDYTRANVTIMHRF